MKKILFSIMFLCSGVFADIIDANRKSIIQTCIDNGNTQKICECGYDGIAQKIDIPSLLDADYWWENNLEMAEKMINGEIEESDDFLSVIELYFDYDNIFDLEIEKCRKVKNINQKLSTKEIKEKIYEIMLKSINNSFDIKTAKKITDCSMNKYSFDKLFKEESNMKSYFWAEDAVQKGYMDETNQIYINFLSEKKLKLENKKRLENIMIKCTEKITGIKINNVK